MDCLTINNLRVSELGSEICRKASLLNFYEREGKEYELIEALKDIKRLAREAEELMQWRQG